MEKIDVNPIGGWQPNQFEREVLESKQMQKTLKRIERILDRHFPPGRRLISGATTKADLEKCLLHRAAAKGCKHARKFIGEFPGVVVLEADEPKDTDLEKIRALGEEFPVLHTLLDRPDRREIVAEAMTVANRCYNGPEGGLLLHFSDDRRGCLLCRMADRGDVKAMALLAKMPTLRVTVATSDQLAEIWARPAEETTEHTAETERYKRELRAALGNVISSEEMIVVIDELHNASRAGVNNQHEALSVVAAKVRSRNFPENQVGQIVTFALAEYNRMIAIARRERGAAA